MRTLDIEPVDPADVMCALGWFGEHKPEYEVLEVFVRRGEIRAAICLRSPSIGDEPNTLVYRLDRSTLTFDHIATERS